MPLRSINEISRTEEWPSGPKKGKKISRSTLWSWVDQGLLKVIHDEWRDGRYTVMVDRDEVWRLMLMRPSDRRSLRRPRPHEGRQVRPKVFGKARPDPDPDT